MSKRGKYVTREEIRNGEVDPQDILDGKAVVADEVDGSPRNIGRVTLDLLRKPDHFENARQRVAEGRNVDLRLNEEFFDLFVGIVEMEDE